MSRPQEVSTDSEEILHDTVNRREPLELSGRLETPHLALTLSGRLMGDLRAVVRVLIGAVKHRWHHRATGGRVAAQLIGNQGRWCMTRNWVVVKLELFLIVARRVTGSCCIATEALVVQPFQNQLRNHAQEPSLFLCNPHTCRVYLHRHESCGLLFSVLFE